MIINALDNVEVREDGHKYAIKPIKLGENVVKYGMPIGHATADIAVGDHVHVHNVATNLGECLNMNTPLTKWFPRKRSLLRKCPCSWAIGARTAEPESATTSGSFPLSGA